METQGSRLESLHEIGEQLIKDADYHNSTAKGIWDQLGDFEECWTEISNSVKERKTAVSTEIKTKEKEYLLFYFVTNSIFVTKQIQVKIP